jgi:hypothetical protein
MRVARRKLAPRIDDGDHGPAHEFFALEALLLHPLPMREATVQAGNFSAKNINQSSPKRPLESLRSPRWFARDEAILIPAFETRGWSLEKAAVEPADHLVHMLIVLKYMILGTNPLY